MNKTLLALCLFFSSLAHADFDIYVGPHFNYTNLKFNNPNELKGYSAGVTAGIAGCCWYLFSNVEFEGTWDAGPITGTPCQRSSLQEYFVVGRLGANFSFCCDQLCFRPYAGFGWNRFENEQDPKTASLCFEYNKLFVPVGFYLDWVFCNCNTWGLKFEYRPDVNAQLKLLSEKLDISCKYAFRAESPIRFRGDCCCCGFWLGVIPFFDWNKFGKVREKNSDGAPLDIPSLRRWSLGLRLLFGYEF